jgi:trehalose synthase
VFAIKSAGHLPAVEQVLVAPRPIAPLAGVVGEGRMEALRASAHELGRHLNGRTVWQVNSTATGGGVAELLHELLGYLPDLGGSSPWAVIDGDELFFEITKRLHNRIHGAATGRELDADDHEHYQRVSHANAQNLMARVRPGDVVVLHDPQTAGMVPQLVAYGACVVWRCHIGSPAPSQVAVDAWEFLRPYITPAHLHVFSRPQYRPEFISTDTSWVIRPSIDPFSAKNEHLDPSEVVRILRSAAILEGPRQVGPTARVQAYELPDPSTPIVTQISRWDRLKDMRGVMHAFAEHVAGGVEAYLILAGPETDGVSDDPEGAEAYAECVVDWGDLAPYARRRIMLASLPMEDPVANARMVNALQRHASVVVQKSLAEGFGLTVAEAMWKARPVVGSSVGGIVDQLGHGNGVLVDPADALAFGKAVRNLLEDPGKARDLGETAQKFVKDRLLADIHLLRWIHLLNDLVTPAHVGAVASR